MNHTIELGSSMIMNLTGKYIANSSVITANLQDLDESVG